ncbi:MAG: type IV toxin-antitoxin system AbiEi family antitoxin [Collimonas sp.]|uniref:type IV toxin-antitoxin system AbiEi family antitoxin n=1 Tax=Collimonas sp. TaxID=1963772 RepID=UPI0032645A27
MGLNFNESLVEQFVQVFEDATGSKISDERQFELAFQRPDGMRRLDLQLRVESPAEELFLAIEILRDGYPRDVRNAVWQLEEYRLSRHDVLREMLPIVIAEHLSTGAREILRERNIGYFDASGSLFLKHKQWLINVDRAAKSARVRRAGSLFTGAREQVIHALLHSSMHQQWLTGLEISHLAETSAYTVSLTMQELERLEWVESQGSGRNLRRRLVQPGKLLDAWSEAWRTREEAKTRWYAYAPNPKELLSTITGKLDRESLDDWAFTGAAAANVVAPLLTHVETAELIVSPGLAARYAQALDLKPADKGWNVTLVERGGASMLFRRQHPELPSWFASTFIQYLDLQDGRGRNKELATHLRTNILKI